MTRAAFLLAATALITLPATAQEAETPPPAGVEEGFSLLEEGARLVLRGMLSEMEPALDEMRDDLGIALQEMGPALRDLAALVGDMRNYHAPERLPNGDIILRRRQPMGPPMPETGPDGQIDL